MVTENRFKIVGATVRITVSSEGVIGFHINDGVIMNENKEYSITSMKQLNDEGFYFTFKNIPKYGHYYLKENKRNESVVYISNVGKTFCMDNIPEKENE